MAGKNAGIKVYACFNKSDEIRKGSSSGGMFFLLAEWIINHGGVVFGAAFNENWEVEHTYCEDIEFLNGFLGSKYVQSKIGSCFKTVKNMLDENRMVLFSGTPCQTEGLRAYLGKDYDNLFLVDFICHGVPSPIVWKKYLEERSAGQVVSGVSFRDKTEGWSEFSLKIDYKSGKSYRKNQHTDIYMKSFLQNFNLRPSCYSCKFKGLIRNTDFTLGDFWKVKDVMPDMYDDIGTSLVLVYSEKAGLMFKDIETKVEFKEISPEIVLATNDNTVHSVKKPDNREAFFKNIDGNIISVLRKYTRRILLKKVKNRLNILLKKEIN